MFGFHSSTIECVCGGEHVGRVIRAYIPSKRLFLDPLGNLNTERLTLYSAWNLNMSRAPMLITLFSSSCLSVNTCRLYFSFPQGQTGLTGNTYAQLLLSGRKDGVSRSRKTNTACRGRLPSRTSPKAETLMYHPQRGDANMMTLCRIHIA